MMGMFEGSISTMFKPAALMIAGKVLAHSFNEGYFLGLSKSLLETAYFVTAIFFIFGEAGNEKLQ